jgi:hypothetical protein
MAPSAGGRRPKAPPSFHQNEFGEGFRPERQSPLQPLTMGSRLHHCSCLRQENKAIAVPHTCHRSSNSLSPPMLRQHRAEEEPDSLHRHHQDCPVPSPQTAIATRHLPQPQKEGRRRGAAHRTTGQVTAAPHGATSGTRPRHHGAAPPAGECAT